MKLPSRTLRGLGLLALASVIVIAWIGWQMARRDGKPAGSRVPSPAAVGPTNGVLLVPVADKSGRPAEPMVPAPVNQPSRNVAPVANVAPAGFPEIPNFDEQVLAAQSELARRGISPGPLDGVMGSQTRAALRAFQQREGLAGAGTLDEAAKMRLRTDAPLYTDYVVTAEDLARLLPLGPTWLAKSEQQRLDFETILELVAERTWSNPKLVRALNPGVDWSRVGPGTNLKVVAITALEAQGRAAKLRISIGARTLQAFDADDKLLAHFPCSIAARVEKRPVGEELRVIVVAPNPNYTFDPEVFPESAEGRELGRKLILQPGPNNPVGAAWIGLDKPGYGIHGTPRPEDVGRTESHGCFRLANWNAELLSKLVTVGTPVFVDP